MRLARVASAFGLLPTLVVVAVVEVCLRLLSLPASARLLGVRLVFDGGARPVSSDVDPRVEARAARVERALSRWPWGSTCLRRALALGALTRSHRPVLHVGVLPTRGAVRAHAWLEVSGTVIGSDRPEDFVVLRRARS